MEILEKPISIEEWFVDVRCGLCETLLRVKFSDVKQLFGSSYECTCICCSRRIKIESKEIPSLLQCKIAERATSQALEQKKTKDRLNSIKKTRIFLIYFLFVIKYFSVLTLYKFGIISYAVINGLMLGVTITFVAALSYTVPMLLNDEPGTFPFGPNC